MPKSNPDRCPYCNEELLKWANPDGTSWGEGFQLVCFNNECSYYKNGWKHMRDKYAATVSYRFRFDPATGSKGPLPVWSDDALRHLIINKGETGEEQGEK